MPTPHFDKASQDFPGLQARTFISTDLTPILHVNTIAFRRSLKTNREVVFFLIYHYVNDIVVRNLDKIRGKMVSEEIGPLGCMVLEELPWFKSVWTCLRLNSMEPLRIFQDYKPEYHIDRFNLPEIYVNTIAFKRISQVRVLLPF